MDYSEFLEWDDFKAYTDYVSVSYAKKNKLIPEKFHTMVPDRCECGSENIIQSNMKRMKCCDPNCRVKMSYAMANMFSNYGIKDLGSKTCRKFVDYFMDRGLFKIPSHVEIIGIDFTDDFCSLFLSKSTTLRWAINFIVHQRLTFGKLIQSISIPNFDTSCDKLFNGVNGIEHFLSLVDGEGMYVKFMTSRGIYDLQKIDSLRKNLPAILFMESLLEKGLKQSSAVSETICITGSLTIKGHRVTKNVFIETCNNLVNVNGVQLFNVVMNSAKESNRYIVASYESNTDKYLVGKRREKYEGRKIVVTPEEYIDILKEEVSGCIEVAKKNYLTSVQT